MINLSHKDGRVLSTDNLHHLERALYHLSEYQNRQTDARDAKDALEEVLEEWRGYMLEALRHLEAIMGSAQKPDERSASQTFRTTRVARPRPPTPLANARSRVERLLAIRNMELKAADGFKVPDGLRIVTNKSRQVRAIIMSNARDEFCEVLDPANCDFSTYAKVGAVCYNHDRPVAKCIAIKRYDSRIEAVAQFPPRGVSALSDFVFNCINSGEIRGASIGFVREPGAKQYELREYSFTERGANPEAVVIAIAGKRVSTPKRRTAIVPKGSAVPYERWPSDAHFCAEWREKEYKRIAAASAAMRYKH